MPVDWSTRIVLRTMRGLVCIRKSPDHPWELPGGKKNPRDIHWRYTAWRELLEETGIKSSSTCFKQLSVHYNRRGKRNRYNLYTCEAMIGDRDVDLHIAERGKDGEEVRILAYEDIARMRPTEFNATQKEFLSRRRLLTPRIPKSRPRRETRHAVRRAA